MKYSAMFHHFHDDLKYPNSNGGGSISASDFNLIIDYIDENYNLLSPKEFIYKIVKKSIKETDVCLTFDDGLKCQFDVAFLELKKRNLNAFFFIYTGAMSATPPLGEFCRDFKLFSFDNMDAYYELFFEVIREDFNEEHSSFLKLFTDDYLSNYSFYTSNDKKYRFLRELLKEKYFEVVIRLMEEKNYSPESRKEELFLSVDNIKNISDSGNEIGLHSHSHATSFQLLSHKEQFKEYSLNYELLSSISNEKITSMSHPLGNYNNDTLKILKKLDIKVGFRDSMFPSTVKSYLEIPREDHTNILRLIRGKN